MERKHDGANREFYWTNKAWYCVENKPNEVMFGLFYKDNGTSGEMAMKWQNLSEKDVPQLQVYNDAWSALATFKDVLDKLAEHDDEDITPEEFIAILKECGFKDRTAYDLPDEMKKDKEAIKLQNRLNEIELEAEIIRNKLQL
mgnify:FL=1